MDGHLRKLVSSIVDLQKSLFPSSIQRADQPGRGSVFNSDKISTTKRKISSAQGLAECFVSTETRLLDKLCAKLERHFHDGHARFYATPRGQLEIFNRITEY